jgi:mannose-6-phosphate isomerase
VKRLWLNRTTSPSEPPNSIADIERIPVLESCTRIPGAEAKTEAWYVIDARQDSRLYAGLKPSVTAVDFERVADGPGVLETLLSWQVRPGDCLLVPGGTVHAIGAGITIL